MSHQPHETLGSLTTSIISWVEHVLAEDTTTHLRPSDEDGAHLWLLDIQPSVTPQQGRHRHLRFRARYLLSILDSSDELAAQTRLGKLHVAIRDHDTWSLSAQEIDPDLFAGLGTSPRAGMILDVPWDVLRPARTAPLVTDVQVDIDGMIWLRGRVLGTGKVPGGKPIQRPLAGASVRLSTSPKRAVTGGDGTFSIPVRSLDRNLKLHVAARGIKQTVSVDPKATEEIVVTLDMNGDQ